MIFIISDRIERARYRDRNTEKSGDEIRRDECEIGGRRVLMFQGAICFAES